MQLNTVGSLTGNFLAGVAQPSGCGTAIIAEGTLLAPSVPGEYRLWIENAFANAVAKDATGDPFWSTRPAVVNASSELVVNVVDTRCGEPGEFDFFLFTECLSGPGAVPMPPPPYVTTGECLGAFDDDNDKDVDLRDFAGIQVEYRPSPCLEQEIASCSSPPECAIDARQPTNPNCQNPSGFESVTLNMTCPAADLTPSSFTVDASPGGPVPTILSVTASGRDATLELSGPISPGQWTCFTHIESDTTACIGFLPGDVNNDRTVDMADMTALESNLNGPPPGLPLHQCDIDRNGVCEEADLDRLEELMFGDGCFDFWLGRSLPACPSGP